MNATYVYEAAVAICELPHTEEITSQKQVEIVHEQPPNYVIGPGWRASREFNRVETHVKLYKGVEPVAQVVDAARYPGYTGVPLN